MSREPRGRLQKERVNNHIQGGRSLGKPIESRNCVVGIALLLEGHEAEALGLAGFTVLGEEDVHDLAELLEGLADVILVGLESKKVNSQTHARHSHISQNMDTVRTLLAGHNLIKVSWIVSKEHKNFGPRPSNTEDMTTRLAAAASESNGTYAEVEVSNVELASFFGAAWGR